ncbi:uncharacterized protein BP01DRAFT_133081 [Aspergillus saccharolyticus JOP 1030-1]|uniref:Uncharacterized protein n=1 Tax=Aspergillus saccharolyticus JOP 1030-1 TaxID=1450539 RepID=A0A318ZQW3_9EURO|nr:hypothetical protein BP01DRAFT_133081 [Aspergillus saccharolyticus JOP 1030-1]PYH42488.1 hypothetical protein BP01DRAFT_133081 [Aspergillus saccharolyticus JOP 1030-1]
MSIPPKHSSSACRPGSCGICTSTSRTSTPHSLDAAFQTFIHFTATVPLCDDPKLAPHMLLLRIQAQLFRSGLLEKMQTPRSVSAAGDIPTAIAVLDAALADMAVLLNASSPNRDSPPPGDGTQRPFTLATHLIAGLYVVCLKSTNPDTIDAALALLRDPRVPRRDGLLDASTAAAVVETLRSTAESGSGRDGRGLCYSRSLSSVAGGS